MAWIKNILISRFVFFFVPNSFIMRVNIKEDETLLSVSIPPIFLWKTGFAFLWRMRDHTRQTDGRK